MSSLAFVPRAEFDRARSLDGLAADRADLFATLARINTLSMIACAGSGHIGSSFSSLDIVSWLHLNEMQLGEVGDGAGDLFYSSKGHDAPGLYSVLIGLGRLPEELLTRLRRLGGLPGHPDRTLTPGIEANTGSLGMGISKAKGIALGDRLAGRARRLYVMAGDGELQEGQIWESLGSAVRQGLSAITVIVDHNKVQSDTYVAETADLGDLAAKFAAFGWHVQGCDGHDLAALECVLAAARADERPSVIIADTVKGRGVSFMEHTAMDGPWYRYHSGAPSPDDYARALDELAGRAREQFSALGSEGPALVERQKPAPPVAPNAEPQRLVKAYGEALLDAAARDTRIVALDADLVLDTGLIPFRERFPERFVECGIAEQDMVSQAGGLALAGMLPVVHSFACFLTPRANEQVYNNATEGTKAVYVGSLAGLVPGMPGHSHQSVRDIALMGCVPGLVALEPSCAAEVPLILDYALRAHPGSSYIRLVSIPCALPFVLPEGYRLEEGRGVALTDGEDAVLITYGPVLLAEAFQAAMLLQPRGIGLKVVNLPWLNRVDDAWLRDTVGRVRYVFTVDNHFLAGGQGERVAARLAAMAGSPPVTCLGLTEVPACGQNAEVLRHHGLDAESLATTVARALP